MTAHVALESLSALLDGELSNVERDGVERHVTGCPACREHLEELRTVADGLGALDRPAAPRMLDLAIASAVRQGRRRLSLRSLRPSTGALVVPFAVISALAIQLLVTHAGGFQRRSALDRPTATAGGGRSDAGAPSRTLRFEAGAWRPASAAPAAGEGSSVRPATLEDWRRLQRNEPELARFAGRHRLELPDGVEWIRFDPAAAPEAPSAPAQPAR